MKKILFALIALVGIVACDSKEPVVEHKLNLLVDKATIIANGEDTVTFTVKDWEGNILEDATIHFADSHEALAGKSFKTKYPGEYEFYARYGSQRSEVWQVTAIEDNGEEPVPPTPDPQEKELKLSVEPSTIYVDETATFKVEYDGNDVSSEATIYLADGDVALDGNTFTATAEGVYTFYAMYEDATSDSVNVNVRMKIVEEEKPIEIEATVLTIMANGADSTKFTVTQDGANVTSQSTIYVNGGVLNGNRFVTTTPGEYTVYAVKGEQKSNELTIIAEEVTSTGKSIIFVEGVTLTSGWYDVNKKGDGSTNGDMPLCWAASASNMLQWWQDRYVAAGKTLPEGAITGPGEIYELAIFEQTFWDSTKWDINGGHPNAGVIWYLEGSNILAGSSSAQPKVEGGYFKSVWEDLYANTYHGYTNGIAGEYNNYYIWGKGSGLETDYEILKTFTDLVVEYIARGPVGMAVYPGGNAAFHTVTIWGYEIDNATGILTRIWLTDDGDQKRDPKEQILNEYSVDVSTIKVFTSQFRLPHFTNTDGTVWYGQSWAATLYPVAGYGSIE